MSTADACDARQDGAEVQFEIMEVQIAPTLATRSHTPPGHWTCAGHTLLTVHLLWSCLAFAY